MSLYLPWNAPKNRMREAENAWRNRMEIVKAYSQGQVARRDLVRWGLISSAGFLAPIHGLIPFVKSAYADTSSGIPTGGVPSPGVQGIEFTQPMLRMEELQPKPAACVLSGPGEDNMTVTGFSGGM